MRENKKRVLDQFVPRRYRLSYCSRPRRSTEVISGLKPRGNKRVQEQFVHRRYRLSYYCRPQSSTEIVSGLIRTEYIKGTREF